MRSLLIFSCLAVCLSLQAARAGEQPEQHLDRGLHHCQGGNYYLALEELTAAYNKAEAGAARAKAAGALGLTYAQMRYTSKAETLLREAYANAQDVKDRAQYGIDLANLQAAAAKRMRRAAFTKTC
jgi:hypothetical protein